MFKKFGISNVIDVYQTKEEIDNISKIWKNIIGYSNTETIKINDKEFPFLPDRFLYYRARAITADAVNQNGDRFPHEEIKKSYNTFIGKGVYYNHNSQDPNNAFGIILDAVYTPVIYGDTYDDKYVEILAAIDKQLMNEKYPQLLDYIISKRVTGTSMGTLAAEAVCSVCGNRATNYNNLCVHMHPQSPLYCKAKKVFGNLAYEDNYGLTFIEDSIVYVPADQTAHILEIYANKSIKSDFKPLIDLFSKYSSIMSNKEVKLKEFPINIYSAEGGKMDKEPENPESKPIPKPKSKDSDYTESLTITKPEIEDSTEKIIDNKIRRIIEEELRKLMAPILTKIDEMIRPKVKMEISKEVDKVKDKVEQVLQTKIETPKAEVPAKTEVPPAEIKAASVDFSKYSSEEKKKLISVIASGDSWTFKL